MQSQQWDLHLHFNPCNIQHLSVCTVWAKQLIFTCVSKNSVYRIYYITTLHYIHHPLEAVVLHTTDICLEVESVTWAVSFMWLHRDQSVTAAEAGGCCFEQTETSRSNDRFTETVTCASAAVWKRTCSSIWLHCCIITCRLCVVVLWEWVHYFAWGKSLGLCMRENKKSYGRCGRFLVCTRTAVFIQNKKKSLGVCQCASAGQNGAFVFPGHDSLVLTC